MSSRRALLTCGGLGVLVAAAVTGCGSSDAVEPLTFDAVLQMAREAGAEHQVALMEDGEVTLDDVWAIDEGWARCYRDLGVHVEEPVVSPVDGWSPIADSSYDGLDLEHDAALRSALDDCAEEWDTTYTQLAYSLTHEEVMAEPLLVAVRECVAARGHEVTGSERNIADLVAGAGPDSGRAGAVGACVDEKVSVLYPDLPYYSVAY